MVFLLMGCLFNKPVKKSNIVGLNNILSSIYYSKRGLLSGKGRKKLFRIEELQQIVPPIINAFAMATDSQDILVLSASHKILLTDNQSYFSMFIKDNELNMVFSSIKSKKSYDDGRAFSGKNRNKLEDPFDSKGSSFWSIIPMGGQRLAKGRINWLIIDLSNNMFGVAGDSQIESEKINPSRSAYPAINKIANDPRLEEEKKKYQDVQVKLRGLKDLKDEGLISEEDYNGKKKELLGEF